MSLCPCFSDLASRTSLQATPAFIYRILAVKSSFPAETGQAHFYAGLLHYLLALVLTWLTFASQPPASASPFQTIKPSMTALYFNCLCSTAYSLTLFMIMGFFKLFFFHHLHLESKLHRGRRFALFPAASPVPKQCLACRRCCVNAC